jgi:hypothetical protein
LLSHSGHRAVVHRSRSETCRAPLRPFVPKQYGRNRRANWPRPKMAGASFLRQGYGMTVRITPILAVAIMIGSSLAYGSPACMTEGEARAKFPKAHLIWRGANHCWTFAAAPVRHPPRTAVPAPSPRPLLAAAPVPFPRPEIDVGIDAGVIDAGVIDAGVIDAGAQCRYSPCE